MRNITAHHARIGFDGYHVLRACALENTDVCFISTLIILFKILLRSMERIRVLHRKLTNADKSAAGTRFVAEFGLKLVYHKRIL